MIRGSNPGMHKKYIFFSTKQPDSLRGPRIPWRDPGYQLHLVPRFRNFASSLPCCGVQTREELFDLLFCSTLLKKPFSAQKEALFRLTASVLTPQWITKQQSSFLMETTLRWMDCVRCDEYLPPFRQNILLQTYALKMEARFASENR